MSKFHYVLAPMEDINGPAFRTLCYRHGADVTYTEMVRVEGLAKNDPNTWARITPKDDTPVVIQLLGSKDEPLKQFLKMFKPFPGFLGFNFNLGCPNPKVIGLGYGCAMVKRHERVEQLIQIVKKAGYKVSIKFRLGLNEQEAKNKVYLNLIKKTNADYYILHARHGRNKYDDPADMSVYDECVATGKKIFANGDIITHEIAEEMRKKGLYGVMIARTAVSNPGIFDVVKGKEQADYEIMKREFNNLCDNYGEVFRYRKNVLKRLGVTKPKTAISDEIIEGE